MVNIITELTFIWLPESNKVILQIKITILRFLQIYPLNECQESYWQQNKPMC